MTMNKCTSTLVVSSDNNNNDDDDNSNSNNAIMSILITLIAEERLIDNKLSHLANAHSSIFDTVVGSITVVKLLQP